MEQIVVLCDGSFPTGDIPLEILNNTSKIVCCDGAAEKLLTYGLKPYAIVGDMDSLNADIKQQYSEIVFYDSCQETNDQTKAINWCVNQGFEKIVILGATGLREDHTIANISLLANYCNFVDVTMVTDTGIFVPIKRSSEIKSFPGQQISIFSLTPETVISTSGLKYDVTNRKFKSWYQGSLNQANGNNFEITMNEGEIILFLKHSV